MSFGSVFVPPKPWFFQTPTVEGADREPHRGDASVVGGVEATQGPAPHG